MIQVSNVCMKYGKSEVLDDITFTVKDGHIVGLLGVNGAGKSTLMNIISGYLNPTSGSVLVDDLDINSNSRGAKKKIGYLPEIPPLYKDMKVYEYLVFAAKLKGVKNYKEDVERVIHQFDLEEKRYSFIRKLSKGMQQRVGFAYAFLGKPSVFILDEPLVGLDPKESKKTREIIRELSKECSVIISSHILKEIEEICDEIMIIKDGKIALENSTSSAKRNKNHNCYYLVVKGKQEKIMECLKKNDSIREVKMLEEVEKGVFSFSVTTKNVRDYRDSLFGYLVGNQFNVYELKKQENSLEDVFMDVTEKEEA